MSRRLLGYAGLGQYEVNIELDSDIPTSELMESDGIGESHRSEGAAAWFSGIVDGTCLFGFDPVQIEDPIAILGALAHEVAHAYREHHQIAESDRKVDEPLTDLTSVYLGFGILTTNGSYQYRSGGDWDFTEYSHVRMGYLSVEHMSFLLAAQVALRDRDGSLCDVVAKQLNTNQSSWFREALGELDSDDLIARLHLPEHSAWPEPVELHLERLPEPPRHLSKVEFKEETLEEPDDNRGRNVFRVQNTRAMPYAGLGFFTVGLPALVVIVVQDLGLLYSFAAPWPPFILGYILGRRRRFLTCSDPDCKVKLLERDMVCHGCGGTVKGTIRHADERLAEEERFSSGP